MTPYNQFLKGLPLSVYHRWIKFAHFQFLTLVCPMPQALGDNAIGVCPLHLKDYSKHLFDLQVRKLISKILWWKMFVRQMTKRVLSSLCWRSKLQKSRPHSLLTVFHFQYHSFP